MANYKDKKGEIHQISTMTKFKDGKIVVVDKSTGALVPEEWTLIENEDPSSIATLAEGKVRNGKARKHFMERARKHSQSDESIDKRKFFEKRELDSYMNKQANG